MTTYTAIFEQSEDGSWAGYLPDLPIVAGSAPTRDQLIVTMREAIEFHIHGLKEDLRRPPTHSSVATTCS